MVQNMALFRPKTCHVTLGSADEATATKLLASETCQRLQLGAYGIQDILPMASWFSAA